MIKKTKKFIFLTSLFLIFLSNKLISSESAGIIKYRQNVMKAAAGHMGAIVSILKNNLPIRDHILEHANSLKQISKMTITIFPKGTGLGKTKAKKSIWDNWSKFEKVSQDFVVESAKLLELAKNEDIPAIAKQIRKTGKTCGDRKSVV